jgi:hypothetical protein
MSTRNHLPNTVEASLGARLAPFCGIAATPLEDLDIETSRAVSPRPARGPGLSLINDLKLLFAALGAGGGVVPLGDNGRTARLLSEYAASLREH